eukprot:gene9726-13123_t
MNSTATQTDRYHAMRHAMVASQLRTNAVSDARVVAAMAEVPREAFLPASLSHLAYLDQAVALPGTGRALMTPMVLVRMIQVLDLQAGERALDYGGGTGYGAAVRAQMHPTQPPIQWGG